jgi:hypothetical protein
MRSDSTKFAAQAFLNRENGEEKNLLSEGKIRTYSRPNPISGPYSAEPRRFPNPFEIKIISGMPFSHCQAMRSSVEY